MPVLVLLRRYSALLFSKLGWMSLLGVIVAHATLSYLGLALFGEDHLIEPKTFTYFYLTTALTVGYGDLSPQSADGRLFVSFWVMVGGIALLTATIGKGTNTVIELWRHRMKGNASYAHIQDHTVLLGWEGSSSERIIELLLKDETSNDHLIVVAATNLDENPLPGKVEFVRGESLFATELLTRAGVVGAERVIIRTACDDQTLTAVLAVQALQPAGHLVAHFNSSETAALARTYAPRLECTSNMATELLVRASQDPGSSAVINELLSVGQGATQYRLRLPAELRATFGELYLLFKDRYNATLIGYQSGARSVMVVNPPNSTPVQGGDLFYIASARIDCKELAHELA